LSIDAQAALKDLDAAAQNVAVAVAEKDAALNGLSVLADRVSADNIALQAQLDTANGTITANAVTIASLKAQVEALTPKPPAPVVKDVKYYGAKGDGKTNDTAAIQKAIDSTPVGEVLIVPAGDYLVDAVKRLSVNKNGAKIRFDDGAIMRAIPNNQDRYYVLDVNASDCDIDVGAAQFIGDRKAHTYTAGATHEHGYCIGLKGARNKLHGNEKGLITGATGDGLAVSGPDHEVYGLVLDGNRRQGCSAFNASRLKFHHNKCRNTGNNGQPDPAGLIGPFCGFDIEPDRGDCLEVEIHDNVFGPNNRSGAIAWINGRAAKETPNMKLSGKFYDNEFTGNSNGAWLCHEVAGFPNISFEFMRNRFVNNKNHDIRVDQGVVATIGDATVANVNVFDDFNERVDRDRSGVVSPEVGVYAGGTATVGLNRYI
jgi:hypothetical protein